MFAVFNRFDRRYEEAARDLGATLVADHPPCRRSRSCCPSLIGVGLFGFTLSYDEFARSLYTSGTFNTLPLEIYGMTTNVTTPVLYALGHRDHGGVVPGDRAGAGLDHHRCAAAASARQRRRQGRLMARRARCCGSPTAGPQDTAPLAAAIDRGEIDPATIVAIVGKTEGNGCVNDFTRGYATLALKLLLAERCSARWPRSRARRHRHVGRHRGRLSPHLLVFCRERRPAALRRRARHRRRPDARLQARGDRPRAQIEATAEAVRAAMKDAGIASAADVHFVQIKCPLLTKERIEEARRAAPDRDRGHLSFDGAVARRLGARRRPGAGRDRGRARAAICQRLVALFQRRQHLGRRRAAAQRDRRAGQLGGWAATW
jgi:hypothetical protein